MSIHLGGLDKAVKDIPIFVLQQIIRIYLNSELFREGQEFF